MNKKNERWITTKKRRGDVIVKTQRDVKTQTGGDDEEKILP